jgi:hypothetical protein
MKIIVNKRQFSLITEQTNNFLPTNSVFKNTCGTCNPNGSNVKVNFLPLTNQVMEYCKSTYSNQKLLDAINFWKKWLSNPITKEKFKKNWSFKIKNDSEINNIFKKYFDALNGLEYYYFYDTKSSSMAFVRKNEPKKIFINCAIKGAESESLDTLIHEIQHLLFRIYPLNPLTQISKAFNGNQESNFEKIEDNIDKNSKKIGIDKSILNNIELEKTKFVLGDTNPNYACDISEKMSNIMAIRNLFGLNPGQNITLDMLKPYIEGKKNHEDVTFLLFCWATKGFPDINIMLSNINQLAMQQSNNYNNYA